MARNVPAPACATYSADMATTRLSAAPCSANMATATALLSPTPQSVRRAKAPRMAMVPAVEAAAPPAAGQMGATYCTAL